MIEYAINIYKPTNVEFYYYLIGYLKLIDTQHNYEVHIETIKEIIILFIAMTPENTNYMNYGFISCILKLNDDELNIHILKLYIEHELCLNCDENKERYKLIHYISKYGTREMICQMLASDADINEKIYKTEIYSVHNYNDSIRTREYSVFDLMANNQHLTSQNKVTHVRTQKLVRL
jgi:hypothetical protein